MMNLKRVFSFFYSKDREIGSVFQKNIRSNINSIAERKDFLNIFVAEYVPFTYLISLSRFLAYNLIL